MRLISNFKHFYYSFDIAVWFQCVSDKVIFLRICTYLQRSAKILQICTDSQRSKTWVFKLQKNGKLPNVQHTAGINESTEITESCSLQRSIRKDREPGYSSYRRMASSRMYSIQLESTSQRKLMSLVQIDSFFSLLRSCHEKR